VFHSTFQLSHKPSSEVVDQVSESQGVGGF